MGFYESTCPSAEQIVRRVVKRAVTLNPGLGAGLIRMHFHDCFVRGCDASLLLDSTLDNPSEKEHPANRPSLRGFEVIDEAKAKLESTCPEIVSCADILAFAARDSVNELSGAHYKVPAGRRDGIVSIKDEPSHNLPPPVPNVDQLEQVFATKGLNLEDMVALSGAHSIGVTHCSVFTNRIHSFNATHSQDPSMDSIFAAKMRSKCTTNSSLLSSSNNNNNVEVALDVVTPHRLDNSYYRNLQNWRGLLESDQALMVNPSTARMVRRFAKFGRVWLPKFANAMVRMGSIQVLTGAQGEIRRNCRVVNQ